MQERIKNYLALAIIAGIFIFLTAFFWYLAVWSKSLVPERQFSVSGQGRVTATPDIAQVSFGVLTEGGKDLANLQKQNSQKANSIITFLKQSGIEEKDIKTQFYNVSPRYQSFRCPQPIILQSETETKPESQAPCPPSEIVGYTINQNILVKIRDLGKVGEILSGVVERGANNVSGPTFTIDDPSALRNQARQEAINKAQETALAMAKAGNFRLGKLISIQEGFYYPAPFAQTAVREGAGAAPPEQPQIEPGSQEITVSITLVYEIR